MSSSSVIPPLISVIIIVYDMPRQALNTLLSFSHTYQTDSSSDMYEVIVIENRSANILRTEDIEALPGNFRYLLRDETGVSPAPAINEGLSMARGKYVGLVIDGARMVTPGVISNVLRAIRIAEEPLVVVPGYHLGDTEHQNQDPAIYNVDIEQDLLGRSGWKKNGYELFNMCCLSGANRNGFFHPFMECNCIFASRRVFESIGGANEDFDLGGGGSLNLYLYYRLALHPETSLVILPGEGSFHQVHGGVTTTPIDDRESILLAHRTQLNTLLGQAFRSPRIEPIFLGKIPPQALRWMEYSVRRGIERADNFKRQGRDLYDDDHHKIPQPFTMKTQ